MSVVVFTVLLLICLRIGYSWFKFFDKKRKLNWLPHVPGWPILGVLPYFKDSSDTIPVFQRFVKENGKLCAAQALTGMFIINCDYEFLEFVLSSTTLLTKSDDYQYLTNWLGNGLLMSTGAKWKQRRRLITPAFHFSILQDFVKVFELNDEIMIAKLKEEVDKGPFDIYPYLALCALDIICETAMGISVDAQRNKDSDYVRTVKEICKLSNERSGSVIKGNDFLYPLTSDYYREQKLVKKVHDVTNSIIDARIKKLREVKEEKDQEEDFGQKARSAFLDILVRSTTADGKPLSREDIREEVDTFMFAGHDTTSTALGFAIYLLANHPEIQDHVFKEQAEIFADDLYRLTANDDLPKMKYLEQVLKETLRFFPPVAMLGRKTTEDITYKGNIIPKDIDIAIFTYGILRSPEYFPNPEVFNPDRWENIDGSKPYAYIPFSAGPRNCIGKSGYSKTFTKLKFKPGSQKYAMLEMKTLLSKIIRYFEVLPVENSPPLILLAEAVVKSKNGINVKITQRKL